MISVILTTHDGRLDFLKKAASSVLNQTYKDLELVIVDDASKDGTEAYCKAIEDKRVKYVRRTKSFGSDTRPKNRGIKESKGEYIAFLDSDNEYRPEHLAILMREMELNPHVQVVYGDRLVIDTLNRFNPRIGTHSNFDRYLLYKQNYIDTSDVLVRREALFDVGGWDERYKKYVDWNLWLRMAKAGMRFKRVPKIITNYYIHEKQKSATVHTKNDNEARGLFIPEWNPYELEIDLPFLHTPKRIKVAVFSLTKDRLEYTQKCFSSLRDKAGYEFDHFVLDQGSADGTAKWLEETDVFYEVKILGENVGISKGSNILVNSIMEEDYDIVIKYDNDCLSITDGWIKEVVELYKKDHNMCYSPYPEGLRDNPGGAPRVYGYRTINGHLLGGVNHLGGLCHIAPASVYKKFRWREDQPLHGMQDLELSQWLDNNGYTMTYIEDLYVEHYEGTEGQHKRFPEYFELRKKEKVTIPT